MCHLCSHITENGWKTTRSNRNVFVLMATEYSMYETSKNKEVLKKRATESGKNNCNSFDT